MIDKAQEVSKEATQAKTSQQYLDGTIALSDSAVHRIDIASRHITSENLREYIDSIVDPDNEMDVQTRKRIADAFEAGVRSSPEAQAQLVIREHFSEQTLRTASTMQEAARADIEKMAEQARTPEETAVAQRAKNSEIHSSREGVELIGQRKAGEISTTEFNKGIERIEETKAQQAEPHRHDIFNAVPENRRQVLARMGLGTNAENLNLVELMHRNGTLPPAKADFQMLREKGYENLPADVQERIAVRETTKHVLLYSGLREFNELALFVAKSKEHEQSLTADEKALIEKFDKISNPNTPDEERQSLAIEMYKNKHPELFKSIEKSPEFQKNAAAAILKTFDENRDKFGVENNPHLAALEKAASDNVTERFAASMAEGLSAMAAGDAVATEKAAKEAAVSAGELAKAAGADEETAQVLQQTTETVLSNVGSAVVSVTQMFSSEPTFSSEIQQQLAGIDLSSLKSAEGDIAIIKDAQGNVDLTQVKAALEKQGISLKDVDKDASGDITGQELLTALAQKSQAGQKAIS